MGKIIKGEGLIKQNGGTIIKPDDSIIKPMEATNVEAFIAAIEEAEKEGVFDAQLQKEELSGQSNESRMLLDLIENAIEFYEESYKRSGQGKFIKFDIDIKMTSKKEGAYIGTATLNFIKWEFGKKEPIISKVFGFKTLDEVKDNTWGQILLTQLVCELIGCAHVLSNLRADVSHTEILNEKMRQANLNKKKDEK